MQRKTQIPKDFKVTDSLRDYSVRKWSLLFLPDAMLADFQHCFDKELGGNGNVHVNWETTFKRYLREASPSGTMHKPWHWDNRCEQARRYKSPKLGKSVTRCGNNRTQHNGGDGANSPNNSTFIPSPVAKAAIKEMKDLLKPYEGLLK